MDINEWNSKQKSLNAQERRIREKKSCATVGLFLSHIAKHNYNNTGKNKWDRYEMMRELRREFSFMFEDGEELSYHDRSVK